MLIYLCLQEAERLEPSDETSGFSCIDYSEKRSLPISIPDYSLVESRTGEKYIVYNIYMAGRHLCARRYTDNTGQCYSEKYLIYMLKLDN